MPRLLLYKSGAPATADAPFRLLIRTRMRGTGIITPMHTQTQVGPHVIWPLKYPIETENEIAWKLSRIRLLEGPLSDLDWQTVGHAERQSSCIGFSWAYCAISEHGARCADWFRFVKLSSGEVVVLALWQYDTRKMRLLFIDTNWQT